MQQELAEQLQARQPLKSSNNLHPDRGYGDDEDEDGDGGVDAAADDGDDDEAYLVPRPATRSCRLCDDMCSKDHLPAPGKLCLLTEVAALKTLLFVLIRAAGIVSFAGT